MWGTVAPPAVYEPLNEFTAAGRVVQKERLLTLGKNIGFKPIQLEFKQSCVCSIGEPEAVCIAETGNRFDYFRDHSFSSMKWSQKRDRQLITYVKARCFPARAVLHPAECPLDPILLRFLTTHAHPMRREICSIDSQCASTALR